MPGGASSAERLVFILPNVLGGGAARVAAILCNEWAGSGFEVHLLTFEEPGTEAVYGIAEAVVRHQVGLSISPKGAVGFVRNNAARVWCVRRLLSHIRPTAVVSFLLEANTVAVVAALGLGIPVLIGERNHPAHDRLTGVRKVLRRVIYPAATRLCVQTEDIRTWFANHLSMDAAVIPNPVMPSVLENRRLQGGRRTAVSLGRLEPQKGHDRLVEAFATIADEVPEWDIVIYGEGKLRDTLQQQIQGAGLEGRVYLAGETRSPADVLRSSDLYLHPARYEGSPNAVLEAMSQGLCVVATDCPGATGEILERGEAGLLVPDGSNVALSSAMLMAMQDADLRTTYGARARKAVQVYAPNTVAARWVFEIEKAKAKRERSPRQ